MVLCKCIKESITTSVEEVLKNKKCCGFEKAQKCYQIMLVSRT